MVPWALLLCSLPLSAFSKPTKTLGVSPNLLSKYVPIAKTNTWKCLDGSKEIPWDFVNDDSCDCPDGSDEPGTSACPNNKFYCQNEGHIGEFISSSRVNDGLCETQCCDGSDEQPGVCPNLCKEIGEEYRKKRDAELKLQRAGAKVRSGYIAFAHQEKKRLQGEVERLAEEIKAKEKEVDRLQDIAERTESLSQAALEHKKESPLYKSLIIHNNALKSLQREHKKHLEREKALGQILDALRTGYNPNYQDMAVLEAVRGWEELAKLPHINDVGKDSEAEKPSENESDEEEEEALEEGMWDAGQLEHQLDGLISTDYLSLLLEHEEYINGPQEGSILFELAAYLPDSFIPVYEDVKDTLVSWLQKFGIVRGDDGAADSSRAQQAYNDAKNELDRMRTELDTKENDIKEIFNINGFGAKGEWKKLDGTCLEKDTGDYTYEVCLFNEVKQKPNNGGTTFSLGKFESWNPSSDVQPGQPEFYQKQVYKHGTRCWNGPERNVVLRLSCGVENALLTVQELEKCEYEITGTSPALCLPPEEDKKNGNGKKKDEL
ncbi:Glucosidase 2 subunit beta [Psilocybe cubensis]|uniref:Glucosidase 2 subunit beta n=1 Tax=Psilocybe cubensis TaxID=181762 RepID=A0ACB8H5U0_PSICU|nr:Glucosidase 2 subunit beta [Psilocybe cubensis]KAH9483089.1 Glucosidase 2 subunit beta [Psilocybe cubensis]